MCCRPYWLMNLDAHVQSVTVFRRMRAGVDAPSEEGDRLVLSIGIDRTCPPASATDRNWPLATVSNRPSLTGQKPTVTQG